MDYVGEGRDEVENIEKNYGVLYKKLMKIMIGNMD